MKFEISQYGMEMDFEISQYTATDYIDTEPDDENDETVPAEDTTPVQIEPGGEVVPVPGTGASS